MNKTRKLAVVLLILATSIASVSGVATYLFVVSKPASVSITLNTYTIELYKEEINPTTIITNIVFPPLMVSSPSAISKTDVMYVFTKQNPKTYLLKWSCSDLPSGFTLKAYYNLAGPYFYEWVQGTDLPIVLVLPNSGSSGMRLYYQLEANNASSIQQYQFIIQIYAGE